MLHSVFVIIFILQTLSLATGLNIEASYLVAHMHMSLRYAHQILSDSDL